MAHTFEIRFNRNVGLAALLEAPSNPFRWKGGGSLSVDAQGLSISPARGAANIFTNPRTRRIEASDLTEVYREGEALRLSFTMAGTARAELPIWARDPATAAAIVRVLPTRRTVELEHTVSANRFHVDWRVVSAVVLLAVAALLVSWRRESPSDNAVTAASAPSFDRDPSTQAAAGVIATEPAEAVGKPAGVSAPAQSGSPEYPAAPTTLEGSGTAYADTTPPAYSEATQAQRETATEVANDRNREGSVVNTLPAPAPSVNDAMHRQYELFMNRADTLRLAYNDLFREASRARLEQLDGRWWAVTEAVSRDSIFDISGNFAMREQELAISRSWRRAIYMRLAGRSAFTDEQVRQEVEFSLMLTAQLRGLLD